MFVLGGVQSDFSRHLAREGNTVADLVGELLDGALAAAGVEASDIQTIHVGNAFGQLFTGQGHLGAMPATVRPALWGVPAMRHEAACASGSMAILAAMAELEAGRYDCALVLGVEQERNVGGDLAAKYLGAAAWVGHEAQHARYVWPQLFSEIGDQYASLRREHLVAIAEQAFANARDNPYAQTRGWSVAIREDETNPIVEGRLRRYDCAQVTDGGAAIVLVSERFGKRGPRIRGWGHRTVGLPLAQKVARREGLLMPHLAACIEDARRRAGLSRDELGGYEVHDCFTTTQYLAIDHLGLTPPGESWRAIESGQTARGGSTPINPGGGLIGGGHPVGATGVRMVLDAAKQVRDAGRPIQTLNLGGSAATVASFVIG